MLNKSRFLRLVGLGLVLELVVIAAMVVSTAAPTLSAQDALPTQMVLPVMATPVPDSQVVSVENIEPAGSSASTANENVVVANDEPQAIAIVPTVVPAAQNAPERQQRPFSNIIEPEITSSQTQADVASSGASPAAAETSGSAAPNSDAEQATTFNRNGLASSEQAAGQAKPPRPTPIPPAGTGTDTTTTTDGIDKVEPLAVIGADSRGRIDPTTVRPNNAIVQIEFYVNGSPYICSGALIAAQYVLTAGHCVYSNGLYSSPIYITPAKNGPNIAQNGGMTPVDDEPYGYTTASIAYVPPEWIATAGGNFSDADVNYDWALLVLNRSFSITPFAISAYSDNYLKFEVGTYFNAGYPGDKCYYSNGSITYCPPYGPTSGIITSGVTQWGAAGPIDGFLLSNYLIGTQIDTFGGQSGSPLYEFDNVNTEYIITGVLSHSLNTDPYWYLNDCQGTPGASCSPQYTNNYFRRVTPEMLEAIINVGVPINNPSCSAVTLNRNNTNGYVEPLTPNHSLGCPTGQFADGTVLSLSAYAYPGYDFTGWTNASGDVNTTFTVNGDVTITANFGPRPAPQNILGRGFYDDRVSNLVYNGGWTDFNDVGPSANTVRMTSAKNAIVSFDYTGNGFALYRRVGPSRGSMEVCIDTTCQVLNNLNATGVWSVPEIFNTSNGTHQVRIRNLSANVIDIDAIQILAPTAALSANTYQETETNFTYIGIWTPQANANAIGGSRTFTNTPYSRLRFNINSSVRRISIYRTLYQAGVYGSLQVFVDGVLNATIPSTPSASLMFGVPYMISVIPGDHSIEIRNVGSTYSDIDQIKLLGVSDPLSAGLYENDNDGLTYSGNWILNTNANALGGSRTYTNDATASVSFKTDNSVGRITLFRTLHQAGVYGSFQVFVDGALNLTIPNNTASALTFQQPISFTVTPGNHIIELRNVGTTFSDIDRIVTEAPTAALNTTTSGGNFEDNSAAFFTYTGKWTSAANVNASSGSRSFTNDPNGRVAFNINNSVGRVVIYRTLYQAGVYGSLQVFVDGVLNTTIPNTPSAALLFQQPFTINVTPGDHRIELRNVGTTYSDIDKVVVLAASDALNSTTATYENDSPNLNYTGIWTPQVNANAFGNNRTYTNDPNARVSFTVNNSVGRITINRTIHQAGIYGSLQVFVDGVLNTTIPNNTASAITFKQPFTFTVPPGNHTIELRNVGTTYSDIDQIVVQAPTDPLLIGNTYEETSGLLTYTGNWTQQANVNALGGSRRFTNDPNGRVAFTVNNTVGRILIYRTTNTTGVYGAFQVFIDGVLNTNIPNSISPSMQFGMLYTLNITPGDHHIELRNVGSTYSDIDRIIVQAAPQALNTTTGSYENDDANLTYNGNWTLNNNVNAFGNSRSFTNDPNGRVSFTINNSVGRITINRTIHQAGIYGSLQVFVDGVLNVTIPNNTASAITFKQPFTFTVTPGDHRIELRNVGTTYSDIDQIVVEAATAPLTIGVDHEDTSALLTFTGKWSLGVNVNALGGTRSFTNDPNGRVAFNINNSVGHVIIFRTLYQAGVYGSWDVYVDGVLTTNIPNAPSTTLQFGAPFILNVPTGNHRIELRNVGTTYSDIDRIVVQAPGSLSIPVTPVIRPTLEPTATVTPTLDVTATLETPTATATITESPTVTVEPTQTLEATLVPSEMPTSTAIPTEPPTATPVPTDIPTSTPLPTVAPTQTPVPTDVPTSTPVPTEVPPETPA